MWCKIKSDKIVIFETVSIRGVRYPSFLTNDRQIRVALINYWWLIEVTALRQAQHELSTRNKENRNSLQQKLLTCWKCLLQGQIVIYSPARVFKILTSFPHGRRAGRPDCYSHYSSQTVTTISSNLNKRGQISQKMVEFRNNLFLTSRIDWRKYRI